MTNFSRRFEALDWKRTALGSRKFRRAVRLAPPDTVAAPPSSALVSFRNPVDHIAGRDWNFPAALRS
jgi:hypothetical protein